MIARLSLVLSFATLCASCDASDSSAKAAPPTAQTVNSQAKATSAPPTTGHASPISATATKGAALGQPAPDFTLSDTEGKQHKLSNLHGKTVVLEWFNPDCPFVKHAHGKGPLVELAKQQAKPSLVWFAVNSSAPQKQGHGVERNQLAKREYSMDYPVLLDENGQVGHAYGAIKTPHLFVIDDKGVLVYKGGLDNAPMGVVDDARPRPALSKPGQLAPYVVNALDDLAAGRPVALAETPAYGCSVKYAD